MAFVWIITTLLYTDRQKILRIEQDTIKERFEGDYDLYDNNNNVGKVM